MKCNQCDRYYAHERCFNCFPLDNIADAIRRPHNRTEGEAIVIPGPTPEETVDQIIERVESLLPRWRAWFPNENAGVEIPRRELLVLIEAIKHERKRADAAEREAEKWRSLSPSDNMTVVLSHERHEELIAAERERDEARKCLVEMSVEAGTQQGHRQLAEAEVERLRALLERAKPMVADWLNHDSAEGTLLTDIDAALEAAK